MAISQTIEDNYSVYPGEYHPLAFNIREIKDQSQKPTEESNQPLANIIECRDHYKIQIAAPGHTKDDFVITTNKAQMNVFALKRRSKSEEQPVYHFHEFDYDYFEYSILLPPNIDTDFVSAEYSGGILSICFQKTDNPVLNTCHPIIVY